LGRTDREPQFIFPKPVYPLSQFIETGHGTAGSWKRQPWHKSRAPKKRKRRGWQVAESSPVLEADVAALDRPPPKQPPPKAYGNPYGEPVYEWFPLTKEELRAARSKKQDKLPLTGGMVRRPGSPGPIEVVKQFADLNGPELRRRLRMLGFTSNRFANRTGLPSQAVAAMCRQPAGRIPVWVERLLEFEEFMGVVAGLLDAYDPAKARSDGYFKKGIEALLEAQIDRLP
jgi:hypothetical protein